MSSSAPPPACRRAFDRVRLNLPARFLWGGAEHPDAMLLDLSAAGAAVRTRHRPTLGDDVVIYAESGVRLAGRVVRWFSRGFAIVFEANAARIARVLAKLGVTALPDAPPQMPTPDTDVRCRRADGTLIDGILTAVSILGVTVRSRARPAIGTPIRVGRAEARVTAHERTGFVVEFDAYWDASARNAWLPPDRLKRG